MDARLWSIDRQRLESLTRADLPALARCMVGYARGLAKVKTGFVRDTAFVILKGDGLEVVVRGDDWAKIVPFLQDNTLSPPPDVFGLTTTSTSLADIDIRDPGYYALVLGVLQGLFTQDYPFSKT